jgi:hypothetical protein
MSDTALRANASPESRLSIWQISSNTCAGGGHGVHHARGETGTAPVEKFPARCLKKQ